MNSIPFHLEENNLSRAWAKVMLKLLSKGVQEISPLIVTVNISDENAIEISEIRSAIDDELENHEALNSCHTTANTIFPQSLWHPEMKRTEFFNRYKRLLPTLRQHPNNYRGIYFERLINYGGNNNQLEHILNTWENGNRRRSEFQAIVTIPDDDQSHARQLGFPCLRQIMFIPTKEGLILSAIYGTQYIFDRAYGNYLGLYRLGGFMAHEMGLPLIQVQCISTIAQIGTPKKTSLNELELKLRDSVLSSHPNPCDKDGNFRLEANGIGIMDDLILDAHA